MHVDKATAVKKVGADRMTLSLDLSQTVEMAWPVASDSLFNGSDRRAYRSSGTFYLIQFFLRASSGSVLWRYALMDRREHAVNVPRAVSREVRRRNVSFGGRANNTLPF